MTVRAEFFRRGENDMVRIWIVGDPNKFEAKAKPEHIERYPREWAAYQAGEKTPEPVGTPLTDIPGFTPEKAMALKFKGVHTAEQLAELHDTAISRLGMGALSDRTTARKLIEERRAAALDALAAGKQRKKDGAR